MSDAKGITGINVKTTRLGNSAVGGICGHTLLPTRRPFGKIEEDAEKGCRCFEDIGLLLRCKVMPVYFIWSMKSEDILFYSQLLRDYLAWMRHPTKDPTIYMQLGLLR